MRKSLLFAASALCALGVSGANVVFNGSFELGTAGFALERELDVKKTPDLKFLPIELVPGKTGNAICVRNAPGDNFGVYSKEFYLKNNTKYRLSADVKGSRNGQRWSLLVFKVDPQWSAFGPTVDLTTGWQHFSGVFTTTKGDGYYHFKMRADIRNEESRAGDFYIDNLRLEEVADTSADKVELTPVPAKKLYYKGDSAEIELRAFQPGKTAVNTTVNVTVLDEYLKTVLASEKIQLSLQPGEAKTVALKKIALPRFGGYRVTVDGKNFKSHDGFFSVIGKYTAKPIDVNKDFVVAFNGGLNAGNLPVEKNTLTYALYNSSLEEKFDLLSKLGCRMMRDHDGGVRGVEWSSVQWNQDKFDFTHLDRQMALYEKNNIILFPVIGGAHSVNDAAWRNVGRPRWVKYTKVLKDPPNCMGSLRGHIVMPDDKQYYDFIYATVKHLKGRVPVYEITNEPNLYLSPENYVHSLSIAFKAIRKADPAAKVSGFCLTSDFSAAATPWMKQCVKVGGLKYVDCIGFHPYRGRTLSALHPADAYIADLRAEMKSYGKPDMPLWNTELYYLVDQQVKHNSYLENLCEVHHCAWRFLVDLGENVVQSLAIPEHFVWKRMLTPNMFTNSNFHERIPSELFVVYNTMARLFEGAKPVAKHKLPNGVICYVYRKDGKLIAAVWSYLGRGVFADFSKFQVMDVFGNAEKAERKALKDAPYYLTPGKLSDAEFLKACKNLSITLDQPVVCSDFLRVAGDTLYGTLYNESAEAVSGNLGLSGKGLIARKIVKFSIPAKGKSIIKLPVKVKNPKTDTIDLVLIFKGNTIKLPVKVVINKLVEGEINMPNMKGTISFGNGRITVRGKIADATDAGPTGKRDPWLTDCVELFFDLDPFNIAQFHAQSYTKNVFRLFITPRDAKKLHVLGNITEKDCKVSVKPEADGYSFEAVINARTGEAIGFDVKIDDAPEETGKIKEVQLGSGEMLYCRRCNFSIVK